MKRLLFLIILALFFLTGCVGLSGNATGGIPMDTLTDIFKDHGVRYADYPYASPNGIYTFVEHPEYLSRTTGGGGKRISFRALPSYFQPLEDEDGNRIYGLSMEASLGLPSGYTISTAYIYTEEDLPGAGYDHNKYFRFALDYKLLADSPLEISAGLAGAYMGELTLEAAEEDGKNSFSGLGARVMLNWFFGKPFMIGVEACPIVGSESRILLEAKTNLDIFAGPLWISTGYMVLFGPNSRIHGPFLGGGLWF